MTEMEDKKSVEETVEDVKENDIPAEDTESVEDQTTETPAGETVSENGEEAVAEEETKERKFFGKKKDKKDKKDEKIEELTDKVKRQMAEFDNYRKRTEKEKASMYIVGAKDIVEKILPVVDNFERGLAMFRKEVKILLSKEWIKSTNS